MKDSHETDIAWIKENIRDMKQSSTDSNKKMDEGFRQVHVSLQELRDLYLDTLNELAAALGDDANFATTVSTNLGNKADKTITISAGTGLTGGGSLSANRTIALDSGSIASLSLADSAIQPGDLATVATSGDYDDLSNTPTVPTNKLDATAAPAATNDSSEGYSVGSAWIDVTNDKAYVCVDASVGAAVWIEMGGGGGGDVPIYTSGGTNSIYVGSEPTSASGADSNTSLGINAAKSLTSGDSNTAVGYNAMDSLTSGSWNTAVGYGALANITNDSGNTAVGFSALAWTTGAGNTAMGNGALDSLGGGNYNVGVGEHVAGAWSGRAFHRNVVLGHMAGYNFTTGADDNTLVGYTAGDNITTGDFNIVIGSGADAPSASGSNQLNIGNTLYGDLSGKRIGIGANVSEATAQLEVTSTTRGFLPPRMTETQRDAISSPAAGLMVYNTDDNKLNFYNGTAWETVTSSV